MMNAGRVRAAGALAIMVALAGCQMGGAPRSVGPGLTPPPPTGVEGEWLSTDGVAMSRFTAGIFETLATDTGNKLAEGTYSMIDTNTVTISVTSLIRQTTTQVNCAMISTTQLNCTSSGGQQFSLVRRTV